MLIYKLKNMLLYWRTNYLSIRVFNKSWKKLNYIYSSLKKRCTALCLDKKIRSDYIKHQT